MRAPLVAACLLVACAARGPGIMVVHVTSVEPTAAVARLRVQLSAGSRTREDVLDVGEVALPPERTFAIETPPDFDGVIDVALTLEDRQQGTRIASGRASAVALHGRRTDVSVTLSRVTVPPLPGLRQPLVPGLELFAGRIGGAGHADDRGADARFRDPRSISCHSDRPVCYVADTGNHVVRRIALDTGEVTTIAGRAGMPGHQDGPYPGNGLDAPSAVAVDTSNNIYLYVAERGAHVVDLVRLDDPEFKSYAFIGTPYARGNGDGATFGGTASLDGPEALVWDPAGYRLYIASTGGHTVRAFAPGFIGGTLSTLGGVYGTAGWRETASGQPSLFSSPTGLAISGSLLVVADTGNHRLRTIDVTNGSTMTLAGDGNRGGDDGYPGRLDDPVGLALLGPTAYVTERTGVTLRRFDLNNLLAGLRTVAGSHGLRGSDDGIGGAARFARAEGAAIAAGALVVADAGNEVVRRIDPGSGAVTTILGRAPAAGARDGLGGDARFSAPSGLTLDGAGHAFVSDAGNATLRRVDLATQTVTTLAGAPGLAGHVDGAASTARFDAPGWLAYDDLAGALYVLEPGAHVIRRVDATTGETSTVAGAYGVAGHVDAEGVDARFDQPLAAVIEGRSLYLVERGDYTVRALALDDVAHPVRILTGVSGEPGHVDGALADARLEAPAGIAADGNGRLFVADAAAGTIRMIDLGLRAVFTFAGADGTPGQVDGCGAKARFGGISALGFDYPRATLLLVDEQQVRELPVATACAETLAGRRAHRGVVLGALPGATNVSVALVRLEDGSLLLSEMAENALLRLAPARP